VIERITQGGTIGHAEPMSSSSVLLSRSYDSDRAALRQPLCPGCYDYAGAVLWNAHDLWRRTSIELRDEMAERAGISRTALQKQPRLSYVKVAEFQARGVVHSQVTVRADGPQHPSTAASGWADVTFAAESERAATSGTDTTAAVVSGVRRTQPRRRATLDNHSADHESSTGDRR